MMEHLDGNALAGPAAELFAFEATSALAQCGSCADVAALAQARVFGPPMGYVARCRSCDSVLLVIVERGGEMTMSTSGLRWVRVGV